MIKLSVSETEWSSLLARTGALILYISIWIFVFGPEKLPGLSRNGPQDRVICFWQGIIMHWKLNTRAPNDVFLLNTLKSLFRLSRVLLDLDRCILSDARTSVIFSPKFEMQFNELRKWDFFQSSLHHIFESENLYEKQPHLGSEICQIWKIRSQEILGNLLHKLRKLYMDGMVM